MKSQISNQLVLALAGTREEVDWQLCQAAALGIREPAGLDYETSFWNLPTEPHRLSILPSRLAGMIQALGQAPWVARAGNGVIYHRSSLAPTPAGRVFGAGTVLLLPVRNERGEGEDSGTLNPCRAGSSKPLLRRIKDAYDPKHVFPELTL